MRGTGIYRIGAAIAAAALVALAPLPAFAGAQVEEKLAQSVVSGLQRAIADNPVPTDYANRPDVRPWIDEMSRRLAPRFPDALVAQRFHRDRLLRGDARGTRSAARARRDPVREQLPQVRDLVGRRPRLHAGDAVLDQNSSARPSTISSTCARTCATAASSCASTSTSKTAISFARSAATTAAWAAPNIRQPSSRR